jgi:hypothetical protein
MPKLMPQAGQRSSVSHYFKGESRELNGSMNDIKKGRNGGKDEDVREMFTFKF